jgi:hypothetical protein
MTRDPLVVRRLDAALARVRDLGADVRAIYVTRADQRLLDRWATHRWRRSTGSKARAIPCSFRDHLLCFGRRSVISTSHGVAIAVPRRA